VAACKKLAERITFLRIIIGNFFVLTIEQESRFKMYVLLTVS
jgi:hypothetical protein